ncbi:MAG: AraC family ligand binding domain-containing protein, partial [Campylobacteraceae bacterium]|nr:AraC family ligand binding domain-containing protein [Campylobacteraceae bacterium]
MKNQTKFVIDPKMPHVEIRYSNSSINYKDHAHDTFSIGALKKGKRLFKYANKETLIKPNMLAIVNANEAHSCNIIDEDTQSEYYVIYIDKTWCFEIQKSLFNDITELHDFPISLLNDKVLY